jgi:hypothetical protein
MTSALIEIDEALLPFVVFMVVGVCGRQTKSSRNQNE